MAETLWKTGRTYATPYEMAYNKLKANSPFFNDDDWRTWNAKNELGTYVQIQTDASKLDPVKIEEIYKFNVLDSDTKMSALMNELYADKTNKTERFEISYDQNGKEIKNSIGEMSDYDYTKYLIDRQAEIEEEKLAKLAEQERKDNMNWFEKLGSTVVAAVGEAVEGITSFVDDILQLVTALGVGLAHQAAGTMEKTITGLMGEEAGKVVSEYNEDVFGESRTFGAGFRKTYERDYGRIFELTGLEDELAEFERKYTWFRDIDGNYTTVGKYVGGTLNSIGYMLPTVALTIATGGGSAAATAAGKAASIAAKTARVASQVTFYAGMASGNINEMVDTLPSSVPTWQIVTNAASKAVVEWGVERLLGKAFGGTMLDNILYGTGVKTVTGKTLGAQFVKGLALDALQKGVEESLQELSGWFVDAAFHELNSNFGNYKWDFQTILDAFAIGALSSIVMTEGKVMITGKVKTGTGNLGKHASYAHNMNYTHFMETYSELAKEKTSDAEKLKLFKTMYGTSKALLDIYKNIGEERFKAATEMLKSVEDSAKDGKYDKEVIETKARELVKLVKNVTDNTNDEIEEAIAKARMTKTADDKLSSLVKDLDEALLTFKNSNNANTDNDSADGKYNIILTEDGEDIVVNGNTVLCPVKYIKNSDSKTLYKNIVEKKLVTSLVNDLNGNTSFAKVLKSISDVFGQDMSNEELVYNLLFNESFFKLSLLNGDKHVIRFLLVLGEIADNQISKIKNDKAKQLSINEYYKIRNNKIKQIILYCTQQTNVDIESLYADKLLNEKQYNAVKTLRYNFELASKIKQGLELNERENSILNTRVNNTRFTVEEKSKLLDDLKSSNSKTRLDALTKLDDYYDGIYKGKYNGEIRMESTNPGNNLYNIFLDSISSETVDCRENFDTEELAIEAFYDFSKGKYELSFVDNVPVITSTAREPIKSYAEYHKNLDGLYSGTDISERTMVLTDVNTSSVISSMVSNKLSATSRRFLTVNDIVNDPSLLNDDLRNATQDMSDNERFLYLRNYIIDKFDTIGLAVKNDGTFVLVNITPMLEAKIPGKIITVGNVKKDGRLSNYVKDKLLVGRAKTTIIKFDENETDVARYDYAQNVIYLGPSVTNKNITYTILHELQHIIQIETGLNLGFNTTWMDNIPKSAQDNIIKDVQKHFPGLLKGSKTKAEKIARISSYVYNASGETEATGYSDTLVDFYPVVVGKNRITMPWGSTFSYDGKVAKAINSWESLSKADAASAALLLQSAIYKDENLYNSLLDLSSKVFNFGQNDGNPVVLTVVPENGSVVVRTELYGKKLETNTFGVTKDTNKYDGKPKTMYDFVVYIKGNTLSLLNPDSDYFYEIMDDADFVIPDDDTDAIDFSFSLNYPSNNNTTDSFKLDNYDYYLQNKVDKVDASYLEELVKISDEINSSNSNNSDVNNEKVNNAKKYFDWLRIGANKSFKDEADFDAWKALEPKVNMSDIYNWFIYSLETGDYRSVNIPEFKALVPIFKFLINNNVDKSVLDKIKASYSFDKSTYEFDTVNYSAMTSKDFENEKRTSTRSEKSIFLAKEKNPEQTMFHEILHFVLFDVFFSVNKYTKYYKENHSDNYGFELRSKQDEHKNLSSYFSKFEPYVKLSYDIFGNLRSNAKYLPYGLVTVHEMYSELSNEKFRRLLKTTPIDAGIAKQFEQEFGVKFTNAYDAIIKLLSEILMVETDELSKILDVNSSTIVPNVPINTDKALQSKELYAKTFLGKSVLDDDVLNASIPSFAIKSSDESFVKIVPADDIKNNVLYKNSVKDYIRACNIKLKDVSFVKVESFVENDVTHNIPVFYVNAKSTPVRYIDSYADNDGIAILTTSTVVNNANKTITGKTAQELISPKAKKVDNRTNEEKAKEQEREANIAASQNRAKRRKSNLSERALETQYGKKLEKKTERASLSSKERDKFESYNVTYISSKLLKLKKYKGTAVENWKGRNMTDKLLKFVSGISSSRLSSLPVDIRVTLEKGSANVQSLTDWFSNNYEQCPNFLYKLYMKHIFDNKYLSKLTAEKFSEIVNSIAPNSYSLYKSLLVAIKAYDKKDKSVASILRKFLEVLRTDEELKSVDGMITILAKKVEGFSEWLTKFQGITGSINENSYVLKSYVKSLANYYDGTLLSSTERTGVTLKVLSKIDRGWWKEQNKSYSLDAVTETGDTYGDLIADETSYDDFKSSLDYSIEELISKKVQQEFLEKRKSNPNITKMEAYKFIQERSKYYNTEIAENNNNELLESLTDEFAKQDFYELYGISVEEIYSKQELSKRDTMKKLKGLKDKIRYRVNRISVKLKSLTSNSKMRNEMFKDLKEASELFDKNFDIVPNSYNKTQAELEKLFSVLDVVYTDMLNGKYDDNQSNKIFKENERLRKKLENIQKSPPKNVTKKINTKVEKHSFEINYANDVPYVVEQLLTNVTVDVAPTDVQILSKTDDKHFVTRMDKFIDTNAELLSSMTEQDAIDIIDFYEKSVLYNYEGTDRFSRLYNYTKLCVLTYIIASNKSGTMILEQDVVSKAEELCKNLVSASAAILPVWRSALKKLRPFEQTAKAIARSYGIVFDESDLEETSNAIAELSNAKTREDVMTASKRLKEAREQLYSFAKKKLKEQGTDWRTKLVNFERFMMLSSPSTWVRNINSNIFVRLFNWLSDKVGNVLAGKFKRIDGQYRLTNKASQQSVDFVRTLNDSGFFDLIVGGATKYDDRQIKFKVSANTDTEQLSKIICHSVVQQIFGEQVWISENDSKVKNTMDWLFRQTMKFLSDEKYIKRSAMTYISKMLTEKNIDTTQNFLTDEIVKIIVDGYTLATFDYMHKPNVLNKLEQTMKRENKTVWFAYKQLMPFAASAWNWFAESLRYTPVGLAKSIINFIKLEKQIDIFETRKQKGKGELQIDPSLTRYVSIRNIGKGTIGTVGFIIGILLAATGKARIDEEDDKIKLCVGDLKIDIGDLFGTQGISLGMAFATPKQGDWQNVMSNILDTMLEDSMIGDLVNTFRYSDNVGDWILEMPTDVISKFYPNFIKFISNAINRRELKYSAGIEGNFERLWVQMIPGVAYTMPAQYDPYTGEYKMKYNLPWYYDVINKFSPVKIYKYEYTYLEDIALDLDIHKSSLTGKYDDIGQLSKADVAKLNEYYGQLNKEDLENFINNKVKYKVINNKTGKYETKTYSKMSDKQKKSVIERIMSNNAKVAKVYVYTENGGKYYADSSEYKELKSAGLKNIFKENKKQQGFK